MVELNHNVVSFNSDTLIKGAHGVIVCVYVSKTGSGSDKVVFKNGTTSSGTAEFTIFTAAQGTYVGINRRFESGIFADVTGSAEITVVFK
jgi:hypothetical protein|tara:strand:- start:783 stop:1052 length:270 start_codon:yes stop_codon:yes gene_type:complete